jgi:hypothetical protein
MTLSPEIRCRDDGTIDLDFYRRAAARERQEAWDRAFDRCARAIGAGVAFVVAGSKRLFSLREPRPLRIHAHLNAQTFTNRLSH